MSEPVSINVDYIFDILNRALLAAIEGRDPTVAKAIAWDVTAAFNAEIGHYRKAKP